MTSNATQHGNAAWRVARACQAGCVLTTTRWTRYGKDRLYVKAADGTTVAWQDLQTGAITVVQEHERDEALAALARHPIVQNARPSTLLSAEPPASRGSGADPVPEAPAVAVVALPGLPPVTVTWTDLALNQPGQGLLAEAAALRAAHPWRCRFARLFGIHTNERAKRVGALGEQMVAGRLSRLPEGWRVLHAIVRSATGTDVDHLVIGPAGVFTVNSKYHAGKTVWVGGDNVRVGGGKPPYVPAARSEAKISARLLSAVCGHPIVCQGLVAVVCSGLTIREQPRDIRVIGRKDLDKWLLEQSADRLTGDQVETIYRHARRSTTWLPS